LQVRLNAFLLPALLLLFSLAVGHRLLYHVRLLVMFHDHSPCLFKGSDLITS
jgi:hypothetical protein